MDGKERYQGAKPARDCGLLADSEAARLEKLHLPWESWPVTLPLAPTAATDGSVSGDGSCD